MDYLIGLAKQYGPNIVLAIVIFFVGKFIAKFIKNLVVKLMRKSEIDETLVGFASSVLYALLLAFVVLSALSAVGFDTTSVAAVLAAAGLAVGLALQGSLSNFAAGVMLVIFRPFKKGDYVEVAGTSGTVEDISIFVTTLKTPDNVEVIVPNSGITNGNITNYSAEKQRRIDLVVGIGYDDDIKKAKKTIEKVLDSEDRVLKKPEYTVAVSELADSSVNLVVRPWVKSGDYWPTRFALTEELKIALDKAGISIPFPQQDVHIVGGQAEEQKPAAKKTAKK